MTALRYLFFFALGFIAGGLVYSHIYEGELQRHQRELRMYKRVPGTALYTHSDQ